MLLIYYYYAKLHHTDMVDLRNQVLITFSIEDNVMQFNIDEIEIFEIFDFTQGP